MAEEDLSPDGLQLVTQGSSNKLSKTVGKATEEDTEANENKSEVNEPIDLNAAFERRESVDNRTENSLTPGNDLLLFGRISEEQEKRNESLEKAKESVRFFAEHPAVVIALSILTLWALYHNDIRVAEFDKDADEGFVVVISITFFLFLFEIIATIFYKPGYLALPDWPRRPGESHAATWIRRLQFGDFFFWLDLVATLSLILEVRL